MIQNVQAAEDLKKKEAAASKKKADESDKKAAAEAAEKEKAAKAAGGSLIFCKNVSFSFIRQVANLYCTFVQKNFRAFQNIGLARWVKRQRYQYKLMVDGKQSTMTAERYVITSEQA